MRHFSTFIGLLAIAFSATAPAEVIGNFALLDTEGFLHELYRLPDSKAVAYVRVGAGEAEEFRTLGTRLGMQGVRCYGILCGAEAPPRLLEEMPASSSPAPVLVDEAGEVTRLLGLEQVGQSVLLARDSFEVLGRSADGVAGLGSMAAGFAAGTLAVPPDLEKSAREVDSRYARDIVPILQRRCLPCHVQGGAGPMAFSSYEKVKGWAPMMREVILAKRMPPWFADPHFGKFTNARGMSSEEERTLLSWLDAGCPKEEEDSEDPLRTLAPHPARDWVAGEPDLVISLPEDQQIPAEGLLDYRHVRIPLKLEADQWIQAVHIRPSNPKLVHHVLMFLEEPGKTVDLRGEFFASFLPGSDPDVFPEQTGKLLPKDATILLQLHYTPSGRPETDRTEVGLYFCKSPPKRVLRTASAYSRDFSVPPGASIYPVKASYTFEQDATLYALRPHMHYRGRRISYEVLYPDGTTEILLSVPAYNFYWQTTYVLETPKVLPAGSMILCQGIFDNSSNNPLNPDPGATVTWGDHSIDEMFVGDLRYSINEAS